MIKKHNPFLLAFNTKEKKELERNSLDKQKKERKTTIHEYFPTCFMPIYLEEERDIHQSSPFYSKIKKKY